MDERMRVRIEFEFPVDPAAYPGVTAPRERADIDLGNFTEDPAVLLETLEAASEYKVTVTPVTITG